MKRGCVSLSKYNIFVNFIKNSFVGWELQKCKEGDEEVQWGQLPEVRETDLQPTPNGRPRLSSPDRSEDSGGDGESEIHFQLKEAYCGWDFSPVLANPFFSCS